MEDRFMVKKEEIELGILDFNKSLMKVATLGFSNKDSL